MFSPFSASSILTFSQLASSKVEIFRMQDSGTSLATKNSACFFRCLPLAQGLPPQPLVHPESFRD
jgi:hypothetical protein